MLTLKDKLRRLKESLLKSASFYDIPVKLLTERQFNVACKKLELDKPEIPYCPSFKAKKELFLKRDTDGRALSMDDIISEVLNNSLCNDVIEGLTEFQEVSREDTFDDTDLSDKYREDLEKEIKKYKRFVITTAVAEKAVDENFLNSIKNYAKRKHALVLVLPSDIKNSKKNDDDRIIQLDPKLKQFRVVTKDLYLNKNLCICSIKTSAKQIKTLTGLDRIATKKNASIIVASTKLFEDNVPTQKGKVPLRVVTTGAITISNYDTDRYLSKRTAYLANEDHSLGAVIVELENDKLFHMRVIEGSDKGTFTDLGIEYFPDGTVDSTKNNVLIIGDSHTDKIDKKLHNCLLNFIKEHDTDTVVLHDVFNATSITHHDKGKNLTRAIKANENFLSLESEGANLAAYLTSLSSVSDVVIVNSNHDRHLEGYLEEGRYISDPINTYVAHKLAIAYMEKKNPLKFLIENVLGVHMERLSWLEQDVNYRRYGVELGYHGDVAIAGCRGSIVAFEKSLGNVVTAHTHSSKRLRKACSVGTVSVMDHGYNHGLSTWDHSCVLLHSNGTKQIVHFIPNKNEYTYTIGGRN